MAETTPVNSFVLEGWFSSGVPVITPAIQDLVTFLFEKYDFS